MSSILSVAFFSLLFINLHPQYNTAAAFQSLSFQTKLSTPRITSRATAYSSTNISSKQHHDQQLQLRRRRRRRLLAASTTTDDDNIIDFQSDTLRFGRGDDHLSALLNENDVVVYQTGTWTVDGVDVGDGDVPLSKCATVDNVQIVWTHNCEHGVIRGRATRVGRDGTVVVVDDDDNGEVDVEFGPEQLVARLPVKWHGEYSKKGLLLVPLPSSLDEIYD